MRNVWWFVAMLVTTIAITVIATSAGWSADRVKEFGWKSSLDFLAPLLLIALVIERAVEILMVAWRGRTSDKLMGEKKAAEEAIAQLPAGQPATSDLTDALKNSGAALANYSRETKVYATGTALLFGLICAAVGCRILQYVVLPTAANPPTGQETAFHAVDIVLTGALLAGGAEPIHKIITTFTTFMDSTKNRVGT